MVRFEPWFWISAAFLILTVPLNWLCAAAAAACVHELGHLLMIRILGCRVTSIRIGIGGAEIETDALEEIQELLCALGGPVGSLALCSFGHHFPRAAFCAAIQCAFNLLPVYPLDGGRALRSFLRIVCRKYWAAVERVVAPLVMLLFILLGIRFHIPAWFLLLFLLGPFLRKIPCKLGKSKVQ